MTKLILLNGPPRCGKNTTANLLHAGLNHPSAIIGYSHHLKRSVHAVYLGQGGWDLDPDVFDAIKNEPQDILGGKSWRQMYIHYSENVFKPLHGNEWLGEQFVKSAKSHALVIIPDSGFVEESERAAREFDPTNLLLLRIHRKGCSFAGDSRSYISLAHLGVPEYDIDNDTDLVTLRMAAFSIVSPWLMAHHDA